MSHRTETARGTSPFNVPLSTGDTARKKVDNPKNIGFRGRHAHGKAPDDPVYPTRQLTASPKIGFVDWRSGGRALLVAAMAAIEGRVLRTRGAIMKWQMFPTCSPSCGWSCHTARNRVLCAWFKPGTVYEHLTRMDGLLTKYKGSKLITIKNPPFRPMSQVAMRNRYNAIPMNVVDGRFEPVDPPPDPAFGIRADQRRTVHPEDDGTLDFRNGYDSDEDPEAKGKADLHKFSDEKSRQEEELITKSLHI